MNMAIVGLGSNIDPKMNIQKAKAFLSKEYALLKESQFVKTKPIGFTQQPDYINGAVLILTEQDFKHLKDSLKAIEISLGRRQQKNKFGPRTIDLDILVWNKKIIDQDFYTRDFTKKSVLELMPSLKY